ncbi:DUF2577 domain-containing protein [Weissella ceti]|uniref:DUF2577 domain-containing protein n=1 Tax=Weissella ceti TaxID=759620 RepID=A0ABT3E5K0_9LACO|nr:DUF2577 family protein [Weissella ceti]MCW0953182.1 DUF2577 domain-containing protein [Weissella ceti]QVK12700.1 DUF2577 family protein [Weissella ceti]
MAGEWLAAQLAGRGGNDSELADIVYGKVSSVRPLEIKIGGGLELPSAMISLGRVGTKYKMKIDGKSLEVDDSLQVGDGVTLLRHGKGQSFYVLDRRR